MFSDPEVAVPVEATGWYAAASRFVSVVTGQAGPVLPAVWYGVRRLDGALPSADSKRICFPVGHLRRIQGGIFTSVIDGVLLQSR